MKVTIREAAEEDLDRIYAWIAQDNPRAAANMVSRIRQRINRLEVTIPRQSRGLLEDEPLEAAVGFATRTR